MRRRKNRLLKNILLFRAKKELPEKIIQRGMIREISYFKNQMVKPYFFSAFLIFSDSPEFTFRLLI